MTLDVNHVLGAMTYLVQCFKEDLESLFSGGSKITAKVNQEMDTSILSIRELDFELRL